MIILKNKNNFAGFPKKELIKLAKNEIKEWQKFLAKLQKSKYENN